MSEAAASAVFAVAAALHLGFQLTVTLVVYPALIAAGDPHSPDAGSWQGDHARHSRRIARVVAPVYVFLLLGAGVAVTTGPDLWSATGSAAVLALLAVTALRAAPLHGRLGRAAPEDRPALLRALWRADCARLALAVIVGGLAVAGMLAAPTG